MSLIPKQIEYLGRWVDTKHFRAFVYNATDQKICNNYLEFAHAVATGLWFESREAALKLVESTPDDGEMDKPLVDELKSKREIARSKFRAATKGV